MFRKNLWIKLSNIVLSLAIVGVFMFLLVLAMAQEQVLAGLNRSQGFQNYNSSLIEAQNADRANAQIAQLRQRRNALEQRKNANDVAGALSYMRYTREVVRLEPVIEALRQIGGCTIISRPVLPTEGVPEAVIQMMAKETELSSVRACLEFGDDVSPEVRTRYLRALDDAERYADENNRILTEQQTIPRQIELIDAEIARRDRNLAGMQGARAHFRVLDSLRMPGWVPLDLADFPPFIIHVMLTFFAGAFGALLITMVFLVYPSKLRERVSAKLYYQRVFLGGLVAVTVFIVIAGGAAILGGEGVATGTNFMSFSAIGLLAGMFSDRVADWLSERARKMFSRDQEDEEKAADRERRGAERGDEDATARE